MTSQHFAIRELSALRNPHQYLRTEPSQLLYPCMLEFYEKRKLKRLLYSRPALVLVGLVAFFMLFPTWNAYSNMQETFEKRASAEDELAELLVRESELQTEIDRLTTEQGIEAEIRRKFEVGRAGEQLIVIVGEPEEVIVEEEVVLPPSKLRSFLPF